MKLLLSLPQKQMLIITLFLCLGLHNAQSTSPPQPLTQNTPPLKLRDIVEIKIYGYHMRGLSDELNLAQVCFVY